MGDFSFDFEPEINAKDVLRTTSLKETGHGSTGGPAGRGKHTTVCRHWLKSLCMKGDKCDYLHIWDSNRMPECHQWLRLGKCTDPFCVFKHVDPSERPLCQRYRLGFCRLGVMCRSRHERMPPEERPELLPDFFIDALLLNPDLVPRADEVKLTESRARRGASSNELALVPMDAVTEQGTIPGLPPPIHGKCRYFMVRSMNTRNIQISIANGIWATSHGNTGRLRQAFRDSDHVVLIFAATESRQFHGYGRMTCEPDGSLLTGIWGNDFARLGPNFRVHWLKQCMANQSHADHIKNPQEDDAPVKRCRDGQELPSSVGERLCRFLWQQPYGDLLRGSEMEFETRVDYSKRLDTASAGKEGPAVRNGKADPKPGAPLALEDARVDGGKKDAESAGGKRESDPSRLAPAHVGTFSRDVISRRSYGDGQLPAPLGQPLASSSSSLMAAVNRDKRQGRSDQYASPGGWRPPPVDPRAMPPMGMPPPGWAPPPGYPPSGYAPPGYPGCYPPPGYGYPPMGHPGAAGPYAPPPGHFAPEPRPPSGWQGAAPGLSQPPMDWHGASAPLAGVVDGRHRRRSRSRRRRR